MAAPTLPLSRTPWCLRAFDMTDLPLVRLASLDPVIPSITTVPTPYTPNEAVAYINRQLSRIERGEGYSFAIANSGSGGAVGSAFVGIRNLCEGRASIGYWLVASARGQGLAHEVVKTLVKWCDEVLNVPRLEAYIQPHNAASIRTIEKAGFMREGLMRSWEQVGDHREDMYMYARIKPAGLIAKQIVEQTTKAPATIP